MPKRTIKGDGKKVPLNMRTTRELRERIEEAAARSGRSLVQEVEHRVEMSFAHDEYFKHYVARVDRYEAGEALVKRLIEVLMEGPVVVSTATRTALHELLLNGARDEVPR